MATGKVYLVPTYLSDSNTPDFISPEVKSIVSSLHHFAVEDVRTARRFISSLKLGVDISMLQFEVVDKSFSAKDCPRILEPVLEGHDLGIISESGLPAIADPGNILVAGAHKKNIEVVALPGASSIILGLIASGFNGQHFTFHGYLPIDKKERAIRIRQVEAESKKTGYTQLFMETPYRNDQLLTALLDILASDTLLFIGTDITGEKSSCRTRLVSQWISDKPTIGKTPTIFGIGRNPF